MDKESREYIDDKFKELNSNMRTFIVIIVSVLLAFGGAIGINVSMAYSNKNDIVNLQTRQQEFQYMMEWSNELSEVEKSFFQAYIKDEDVSKFFKEIDEIKARVYGIKGLPSYRGNQDYIPTYKKSVPNN
jgi:hypothetical protein